MPTLDEIHRRIDQAGGDDPRNALIAVRKLLNEDVPWLERRAVQLARSRMAEQEEGSDAPVES